MDFYNDKLSIEQKNWQLQSLLDCSIQGLLLIRKEQITYANRASRNILDQPIKEFLGKNFLDFINISLQADPKISYSNILVTNYLFDNNKNRFLIKTSRNQNKWLKIWGIELALDSETSIYINIVDITEMVEHEIQIMQTEKMATIGQLASGVAHEINNPLAYINSNLETMKQYTQIFQETFDNILNHISKLDHNHNLELSKSVLTEIDKSEIDFYIKDSYDLLDESLNGVKKAKKIIKDLQLFSPDTNTEFSNINVHDILKSIYNIVWNKVKYIANLKFKLDAQEVNILGNQAQIGQIFIHLILNATSAIQEKKEILSEGYNGKILIRTKSTANNLLIRFSDNGIGIKKEMASKIFDPFFTTKEVGKNTGMGLSLSQEIIFQHNGRLFFKSQHMQGSSFTIKLPLFNEE